MYILYRENTQDNSLTKMRHVYVIEYMKRKTWNLV